MGFAFKFFFRYILSCLFRYFIRWLFHYIIHGLLQSQADKDSLENVTGYIADHYAFEIPLSRLASIACMSESKLKTSFKRQFGCSVTQYIQGRRMSQAEHLLINTDFTMGQIAQMIGYTTSSRFAELFKKSTGILPIEYRKIARKDC